MKNINKLTIVLGLLIGCLNLQGQSTSVSIKISDVSIEKLMLEIKNKTGYDFILNDDIISQETTISIDMQDVSIELILDEVSNDLGLDYKITNNTIILLAQSSDDSTQKVIRTQTLRGKVIDKTTKTTLPGATILLTSMSPNKGVVSDESGNFIFKGVPVGRHAIKVSFVGYKPVLVTEILVISAKEAYVKVNLEEMSMEVKEVVVNPTLNKDRPLNDMATVSARSFTVEESKRYAGGVGDPTRMVSSYAGVSSGYELDDNGISVRGHRPGAIVWRIEDVEVPNPNHFAGAYTAGAGFVCLVSNQLMDNSDFYTGAFPSEIGNSLSAAFDLKLRTGNNNKREYTFQAGVMGIDFGSEGPIVKGKKASYNINYRYSTLGLLTDLKIVSSDFVPRYQDLTYKFNFPTSKAGTFTLWGTGGIDYSDHGIETDSSRWDKYGGREGTEIFMNMGAFGFSHRYSFGRKTYLKTSVVASGAKGEGHAKYIDDNEIIQEVGMLKNNTRNLTFSTFVNHKFGKRHTNRTGINIHNINYDIDLKSTIDNDPSTIYSFGKANNSSYLMQFYTQSKFILTESLSANVGVHTQFFALNENYTVEPRLGLNWQIASNHRMSAGYGLHSQLEELRYYFIQDTVSGEYLNQDLDFAKAHHFVLGYDWNLNEYTHFKVEPYYQVLYNYPGIQDSSFSMINMEQDWLFDHQLANVSKGINYGIDVTVERFLKDNYYYLATGSLYQSKYTGDDGITRNTRFDRGYAVNVLMGKEFFIGEGENNILSVNIRANVFGGKRKAPIDWESSEIEKEIVYDYDRIYEEKDPIRCYIDLTVRFIQNKEKYTSTWSLEILNLIPPLSKRTIYNYEESTGSFNQFDNNNILVPILSYKIEF